MAEEPELPADRDVRWKCSRYSDDETFIGAANRAYCRHCGWALTEEYGHTFAELKPGEGFQPRFSMPPVDPL